MNLATLQQQNERFSGTGGVSRENRAHALLPAFRDSETGVVYRSRFADGRAAPVHILDGLPESLVTGRCASGRVLAIRDCVLAGFVHRGCFYTRAEARALCAKLHHH